MAFDLDELLEDPCLVEIVAALERRLEVEQVERERLYRFPDDIRAEFINGAIIMRALSASRHSEAIGNLSRLLSTYVEMNDLGLVVSTGALCTFPRNDYLPDLAFFGSAKAALIEGTTWQYPVPDFICEVLGELTEERDRGIKLVDYEAHGVAEYWMFDPATGVLEQYVRRGERFELVLEGVDGEAVSEAIPGFRFSLSAFASSGETMLQLFAMQPRA